MPRPAPEHVPAPSVHDGAPGPTRGRGGGPRVLAALALVAALAPGGAVAALSAPAVAMALGTSTVVAAPPAQAVPADQVDLADTAGILDRTQLLRDLAEVEFRQPTRVAVFTERGPDIRDLDEDRKAQAFNGRVLEFARAQRPDWLSADGQKWADGLVVVALDPDSRMLGVYQGEDRRLSTDQQAAVREDAVDAARDARWTDAVVDVVDGSAERIGRPWHEEPGVWVGAGVVGVVGAGVVGATVAARRSRRRRADEDLEAARRHLTSVTLDQDATEVNASTVPDDVPAGARLLERFRSVRQETLDATAELARLDAVPRDHRHRPAFGQDAQRLRRTTAELDTLDDVIADANTFLNRRPGWPDAWDRQTAPLRADLDAVESVADRFSGEDAAQAPVAALRSFRAEAAAAL